MESQKIVNLLEQSDDDDKSKFVTKKWYFINDQNHGQYGKGDQNDSTIKFSTDIVKSFLVDYSEAYILVTGNIMIAGGDDNTRAAIKDCHPFIRSVAHLNDEHVGTAENLDFNMNMYNLLEYSDNYADISAPLYQYKRLEQPRGNNNALDDVTINNSSSFKYKSSLIGNSIAVNANTNPDVPLAHRLWRDVRVVVPLKHVSNFFRKLEILLINTKLYIELNCIMTDANANAQSRFQITKTELYVTVVTLNTKNNDKLHVLLRKGFKWSLFWNEYKSKIQRIVSGDAGQNTYTRRILLDVSYQGVKRLFVIAFDVKNNANQRNDQKKIFLPRICIKDYNVMIDGHNFYDQNIDTNDSFKAYSEVRKIALGKGDDYTTG